MSVCEWCSAPLTARQVVACSASHRLKRWRWLNGIPVSPYGGVERPPEGSVLLDGPSPQGGSGCRLNGSAGGLQVSARKMMRVLEGEPFYLNSYWSGRLVGEALSVRQRERWEAQR